MGERSQQTHYRRRSINSKQIHYRMFNVIRKMQIKTTTIYLLKCLIQKIKLTIPSTDKKHGPSGTLILLMGMKMVQLLWKTACQFLVKVNITCNIHEATLLLCILL